MAAGRRVVSRGFLAFSLAVVAGCAGGSERPVSIAEWIDQANAVCAEAEGRAHALGEARTIEEVAEVTAETREISEDQLRELTALRRPEAEQAMIMEFLAAFDASVEALVGIEEAAESGDSSRVDESASRFARRAAFADRRASRLGLEDCRSDDF